MCYECKQSEQAVYNSVDLVEIGYYWCHYVVKGRRCWFYSFSYHE